MHSRSAMQDNEGIPLEHRFTDTPDGNPAGTWWSRKSLAPWCSWRYNPDDRHMEVVRGSRVSEHRLPRSAAPHTLSEEQSILPLLALHLARQMERPKSP